MKFLYHAWDGAFGLGDNLVVPTYCKAFPNHIPAFCLKQEFIQDFSKIKFIVDGKSIKYELFSHTQVKEYQSRMENSINVSHLSLKVPRNRYDIELPECDILDIPPKFVLLHHNSYIDLNWPLNTGRYIWNHTWDMLFKDKGLMHSLKPIINFSPERKKINNDFITTRKFSLLELMTLIKRCRGFVGCGSGPSVLAHVLGKKCVLSWTDDKLFDGGFANWCLHVRKFFYPFDNVSFFHPQSQKVKEISDIIKLEFSIKIL